MAKEFLEKGGPELHQKLQDYAANRASYIEEFWVSTIFHEQVAYLIEEIGRVVPQLCGSCRAILEPFLYLTVRLFSVNNEVRLS